MADPLPPFVDRLAEAASPKARVADLLGSEVVLGARDGARKEAASGAAVARALALGLDASGWARFVVEALALGVEPADWWVAAAGTPGEDLAGWLAAAVQPRLLRARSPTASSTNLSVDDINIMMGLLSV